MPLAMQMMSGSMSRRSTANHSPVRPKPRLDLVGDEEDAVLAAALDDALDEALRGAGRSHPHRAPARGSRTPSPTARSAVCEQPVERPQRRVDRRLLVGGERVGERRDVHAGRQRRVTGPVDRLRRRHRHRRDGSDRGTTPGTRSCSGASVACFASLTAASVISAPEFAKKNVSMTAWRDLVQLAGEGVEQVVGVHVGLGVDEASRPARRSPRSPSGGSGRSS